MGDFRHGHEQGAACSVTGKVSYPSMEAAVRAADRLNKRAHQRNGRGNKPFRCHHCAGFHIGHSIRKRRFKK